MNLNSILSSDTIMLIAVAAIAALFGFLIGLLLTRLSLKGKDDHASQIQALEDELATYKDQVSTHFVETAELVNTMSQSYNSVYEHLQKGAVGLVGEDVLQKRLPIINKEPIQIETVENKHSPKEESITNSKRSFVEVLKTRFNFKKNGSNG